MPKNHGEETGEKCYYCSIDLVFYDTSKILGTPYPDNMRTKDHRVAKSKEGFGKPRNIVYACRACNEAKADMTEMQFIQSGGRFARAVVKEAQRGRK